MVKRKSIVREYIAFLKYNKAYWMLPIVFVLFAMGVLLALGGGAAGPFVYTFF